MRLSTCAKCAKLDLYANDMKGNLLTTLNQRVTPSTRLVLTIAAILLIVLLSAMLFSAIGVWATLMLYGTITDIFLIANAVKYHRNRKRLEKDFFSQERIRESLARQKADDARWAANEKRWAERDARWASDNSSAAA